jgi:hypothetical protein
MTRLTRPFTTVRRGMLIAATAGAVTLAAAPLASAAPRTARHRSVAVASPGTGVPVFGGLIDSVVGILTGTAFGIGGAAGAVVCSVVPVCSTIPAGKSS